MEKRDRYVLILKSIIIFLSIGFIVIITLFITGNITFNKKSNNNDVSNNQNTQMNNINNETVTSQNSVSENTLNTGSSSESNFDPYSNYKNVTWSTNTQFTNDVSNQYIRYTKVYISDSNIIKIDFSDNDQNNSKQTYSKDILIPSNDKIKCFEYVYARSGDGGLETIVILSQNGNLYYVEGYNNIYSHDSITASQITLSNKALEIVNKMNGQPDKQTITGIYVLLDDGNLYSIDYKNDTSYNMTCILGSKE